LEGRHQKWNLAYLAALHSGHAHDWISAEAMGDYNPTIGVTLVFRWREGLDIPASVPSQALGGSGDPNFDAHAHRTDRGWTIGLWQDSWPETRNGEDLRAECLAEDGDFVLRMGATGGKRPVVVDGKGASVRVGDRNVSLSPEGKTTIVIGGNPKKEPLRLLRVETARPSPIK
jgi:hypothetical protein